MRTQPQSQQEYVKIPRLNVIITEEQEQALQALLPWGQRGNVMRALVDSLISLLQNADNRPRLLAMILSKQINIASKTMEQTDGHYRNAETYVPSTHAE